MNTMERYKVDIPEGESGDWSIKLRTAPGGDSEALRRMTGMFNSMGRYAPSGTYTTLSNGRCIVMSDTPDEIRDHMYVIRTAEMLGGNMLVNGLGIGMVTKAMLENKRTKMVTVVEINKDVIDLVGPTLSAVYGDRINIVHADALEHRPPKNEKYTVVWHDIWSSICSDNLTDMHKLHRKYGRRSEWQGSWCRGLCERMRCLPY